MSISTTFRIAYGPMGDESSLALNSGHLSPLVLEVLRQLLLIVGWESIVLVDELYWGRKVVHFQYQSFGHRGGWAES